MKMRITIEVERPGASLTDDDLFRAVSACARVIDVDDVGADPCTGHSLRGGIVYGYAVEEVKP